MLLFKASPEVTLKGTIMRSGLTAIIPILGVSWLDSSFFEGIVNTLSAESQGSYIFIRSLSPSECSCFQLCFSVKRRQFHCSCRCALALGPPVHYLIGFYPAANGPFFLPTYGTVLAAVSFDQTGTTRSGKYLLNHSFMRPGLVTMILAVVIALLLSTVTK